MNIRNTQFIYRESNFIQGHKQYEGTRTKSRISKIKTITCISCTSSAIFAHRGELSAVLTSILSYKATNTAAIHRLCSEIMIIQGPMGMRRPSGNSYTCRTCPESCTDCLVLVYLKTLWNVPWIILSLQERRKKHACGLWFELRYLDFRAKTTRHYTLGYQGPYCW